jgi:hypothetical protein
MDNFDEIYGDHIYREVAGAGIEVSRSGRVQIREGHPDVDQHPWLLVPGVDGIYRVNILTAVALTWMFPRGREILRNCFSHKVDEMDGASFKSIAKGYNVSPAVVEHIIRHDEHSMILIDDDPIMKVSGLSVEKLRGVGVLWYECSPLLNERVDNTELEMYLHKFFVGSQAYVFASRGIREWVTTDDTVDFDYVTMPDGTRVVLTFSLKTKDATGKKIIRGRRGWPVTLRSSAGRLDPAAPSKVPWWRRKLGIGV